MLIEWLNKKVRIDNVLRLSETMKFVDEFKLITRIIFTVKAS